MSLFLFSFLKHIFSLVKNDDVSAAFCLFSLKRKIPNQRDKYLFRSPEYSSFRSKTSSPTQAHDTVLLKSTISQFTRMLIVIFRHVNFDVIKAVIVASTCFVKQQFFDYMYQQVSGLLFYIICVKNQCCGSGSSKKWKSK